MATKWLEIPPPNFARRISGQELESSFHKTTRNRLSPAAREVGSSQTSVEAPPLTAEAANRCWRLKRVMTGWKKILSLRSSSDEEVDAVQIRQVLSISDNLLKSLVLFNREGVWKTITAEIRELFDCELASLFLVDEEAPDYLVLEAQEPWTTKSDRLRLHIESTKGAGLTAHAAAAGEILALDEAGVRSNEYVKDPNPSYLQSGTCYSALFAPLKNRKGRLIGLLRLNNKHSGIPLHNAVFTPSDLSVIELVAAQIVVHIENANAFETMRGVVTDVQIAKDSTEAIRSILKRALGLLHADYAQLAIWSRVRKRLEVAGTWSAMPLEQAKPGDEIEASSLTRQLWDKAVAEANSGKEDLLNVSLGESASPRYCNADSRSFLSTVVIAHAQPIGVLHLESGHEYAFDALDREVLRAFAENTAIAVQSFRRAWSASASLASKASWSPSLGEAEGLYHSIVEHLPTALWRKDADRRFAWVNQRFCETIGKSRDQIIGRTEFELFSPDYAERFHRSDEIALAHGEFEDMEEPYPSEGGEVRRSHVIKQRITDVLGQPVGTQGMFVDITGDPLRQLFSQAPVGFCELDGERRIRHVNEALRKLTGYSEEPLVGKPFETLVPESDQQIVGELLLDLMAGSSREPDGDPLNLRHKEGRLIPVLITGRTIPGSPGANTGRLLCTVREIRTGLEIEQALLDPDSHYLARIRELSLPVFCLDLDSRLTFVNDAYLESEGLGSFREIEGKTDHQRYGKEGQGFSEDNDRVRDTGIVIDKIEFHPFPDGQQRLVRVLKFPLRDSTGAIVGVQGVFWELAEQETAQSELRRALKATMEEYQQIVYDVSDGIFQADMDGRFIGANPAMCKLLGYGSEDELLRRQQAGTERFLRSEDRDHYFDQLKQTAIGTPVLQDYPLRRPDGEVIWVSETAKKVPDEKRRARVIGIVEDISQRRKDVESREQMLTMLAHQLRSPVQQSHKRAESLVRQMDPDGQLEQGHASMPGLQAAIVRGLTRKTKAVAWSIDLLSKLAQSDEITDLKRQAIPARRLIKMAREAARDVALINRESRRLVPANAAPPPKFENVEVNERLVPDSPQILGDGDLIEQCVGNLVENAFKYSLPDSLIQLVFELQYRAAVLKVRNRPLPGLEIDAAACLLCRRKEWRSAGAAASNADGSGLGLWLTDRIMVAHGGRLEILETDKQGWNEFALSFPLSRHGNP
ncbi:MAG: PAS domain S-box protein [Verrucomicrobiales bacterium]|nr:PAS domain S-box protein [Verrucomicrobiales bacterium]MCP5528562.1 PAS domain S-box protein [Verrucomicrobiales bacterium]